MAKVLGGALLCTLVLCQSTTPAPLEKETKPIALPFKTGAEMFFQNLSTSPIKGKRVGVVANIASVVGSKSIVDSLRSSGFTVVRIFAPEHGFRGEAEAGAKVDNGKDPKTGIPVVSLYGKNFKPSNAQLADLDAVIFDIQDVGARFYTYLSTLHYVMEACASADKPLYVLDRPNPNGHIIDGPVLDTLKVRSFVGLHPVPICYGMTIGEYAKMILGESWTHSKTECELHVVPLQGYNHKKVVPLPIPPSPNLRTAEAIRLYPSLCLFEATPVSIGRGTPWPFEVVGCPKFSHGDFKFTPSPIKGQAEAPPLDGKECSGFKLTDFARNFLLGNENIYFYWLDGFYTNSANKKTFFQEDFFDKLAGGPSLRQGLEAGKSMDQIRAEWQPDLLKFKDVRKKYVMYED